MARATFSPTTEPMLAPMKLKSATARRSGDLLDGAGAADDGLGEAGLALGLDELVLVALAGADEPERVAGSQVARPPP